MKIGSILKDKLISLEKRFNEIYEKNSWGSVESKSGPGSELSKTEEIRRKLPELFAEYNIKSILDIPCGDFNWIRYVDFTNIEKYIGMDIVPQLISENNSKFGNSKISFRKSDLARNKLPKVDLILCRDCFVHFSYSKIKDSIRNIIFSNSRYLLTTSFSDVKENSDILSGDWRKINLLLPPFNFPEPILSIKENNNDNSFDYKDKFLLLWEIKNIRPFKV